MKHHVTKMPSSLTHPCGRLPLEPHPDIRWYGPNFQRSSRELVSVYTPSQAGAFTHHIVGDFEGLQAEGPLRPETAHIPPSAPFFGSL